VKSPRLRNKHGKAKDARERAEARELPYRTEERIIRGQRVQVKVYPSPIPPSTDGPPTRGFVAMAQEATFGGRWR
jgi:hypothetical protein